VAVRVTVKDGLAVQTEVLFKPAVGAGGRLLESPTLENLKTWRFAADVTGAFTVTYTYEISGTETEEPTNAKVEMLPSLRRCAMKPPLRTKSVGTKVSEAELVL
jgi:hypothetical protein